MPAFFKPHRSSRHRAACLALYRALLQRAALVPLPPDVLSHMPEINPLKRVIRTTFVRNKHDTSPRLIISSLRNGYKFLETLGTAQDPDTLDHASLISFLRDNQEAETTRLAAKAARAPVRPPQNELVPLLRKLPPLPGSRTPRYEPNRPVRPLAELRGTVRKIPVLDDAMGLPFLRLKKPQPYALTRMILHRKRWRVKLNQKNIEIDNEMRPQAKLEDAWEALMARLGAPRDRASFEQPLIESQLEIQRKVEDDHLNRVARSQALWSIVEAEMNLAEAERLEREAAASVAEAAERPAEASAEQPAGIGASLKPS